MANNRVVAIGLTMMLPILLSACATPQTKTSQHHQDPAIAALNKTANRVAHQLQLLNATKHSPKHAHIYPIPHQGPMSQHITLTWAGPIKPAVKSVAQLVGYHFKVAGRAPASDIIVNVHAAGKPAFAVLQNLGWQAGAGAGIVVRPGRKLIMLVYQGSKGA